jgi:protein disulfide-isomerase
MKRLVTVLLLWMTVLATSAADAKWYYDLAQAQAIAGKENKLVFMDFTGSDWCGWCMKIKKEVFSTPEFNDYARSHLVLVEVDLPRAKPLSIETLMANTQLQERFKAEGFPTIVVLNGKGTELWRIGGYAPMTTADWIALLEQLRLHPGSVPSGSAPVAPMAAPKPASN